MVSTKVKNYLFEEYGIKFKNETLLEEAFTHSSYVNEHPKESAGNYEKLEFLGDAVLELAVSDYLYRHFPSLNEGQLTRLRSKLFVQKAFLALLLSVVSQLRLIWGAAKKKQALEKEKLY